MAIKQEQSWRIREAINKKISRQLEQGITPLTIYKTFFPFEEGGDIIDRRTGMVKTFDAFVREQTKAQIGSKKAYTARLMNLGMSKSTAARKYAQRKAAIGRSVSSDYGEKLRILAGMDITETREAKAYQQMRIDEIVPSFLAAIRAKYGGDSPEFKKAVRVITGMNDQQLVHAIREAAKKSRPGKKQTQSFYKMLAEVMGVDDPGEKTP